MSTLPLSSLAQYWWLGYGGDFNYENHFQLACHNPLTEPNGAIEHIVVPNVRVRKGLAPEARDLAKLIIEYYQYYNNMNITRLNFKEALPFLLSTIQQSHFVAMDLEMSGIISSLALDPSLSDSIQTRYYKTKCKAEKFLPLQLGLCPFRYNNGKMTYSPFNIYLYPLSLAERMAEQFTFNSESMRFLAKNNFDFNRLFYEGVPFMSPRKMLRYQISQQQIATRERETNQYLFQSPDVAAFLKMRLNDTTKWVSLEQKPTNTNLVDQSNPNQFLVDIQFIRVRAYQNLVYQITKKYPSLALKFEYLDKNKNKLDDRNVLARKYLKIIKLTPEQLQTQKVDLQKNEKEQNKGKNQKLQLQSVQLNKIWQLIRSKSIPLVVHNGFLDLMHLYNRFIDDLPTNELNYRINVHKQFPIIYDTKYICNNNPVLFNKFDRDTSLGNCYKVLRSIEEQQISSTLKQASPNQNNLPAQKQSQINELCNEYKFESVEHHEAGYDALMTAYTFVNAMKVMHNPPNKIIQPEFHTSVQYFCNKVPLGNIRVPYNFNASNQSYQEYGTKPFYFTCLQKKQKQTTQTPQSFNVKQMEIQNALQKQFGPVRIVWEDKDMFNFVLTFLNPEHQAKFQKTALTNSNFGLYNIGDDKFLVSSKLRRQKKLYTAQSNANK